MPRMHAPAPRRPDARNRPQVAVPVAGAGQSLSTGSSRAPAESGAIAQPQTRSPARRRCWPSRRRHLNRPGQRAMTAPRPRHLTGCARTAYAIGALRGRERPPCIRRSARRGGRGAGREPRVLRGVAGGAQRAQARDGALGPPQLRPLWSGHVSAAAMMRAHSPLQCLWEWSARRCGRVVCHHAGHDRGVRAMVAAGRRGARRVTATPAIHRIPPGRASSGGVSSSASQPRITEIGGTR
jgi:hypothetical protein